MRKPRSKTLIILGVIAAWILLGVALLEYWFYMFVYIVLTVVALIVLFIVSSVRQTVGKVRGVMGDIGVGGGGTTRRSPQADRPAREIPTAVASPELLAQIDAARGKSRVYFILCGVCAAAAFVAYATEQVFVVLLMVIAGLILLFIGSGSQGKANKLFKDSIVKDALLNAFDEADYNPSARLDLFALGFFPGQTDQRGGDYVSASYKGRAFKQSDNEIRKIIHWIDDEGDEKTRTETLFFGRFMELAYNTSVDAATHVIGKDFKYAHAKRSGWEQIETELDSFNGAFDVYTTDPVAALTALVPPMLESIMRLNAVVNRPMAFSFQNDYLHILISMAKGENAFEAFAAHGNEKSLQKLSEDIQFIRDVLDNLYTK